MTSNFHLHQFPNQASLPWERLVHCFLASAVGEFLLFADEVQRDATRMSARAVLPQINSLPRSERELSGANGNRKVYGRQRGADVRGHIVVAFRRVDEQRVAVRHKPFEE